MHTRTKAAFALALSLVFTTAHADLTVGVSLALTGPGASLGLPARNALALWPDTLGGEKVRVIVLDDAADPTIAMKNARRFVEDKVDVIVGASNTPATIAIAQVADEGQTVQISPSPAELQPGRDKWVFRDVMHAEYYTEGILLAMKAAGVKTLGFLGLSDAYGESHLVALDKQAAAMGIKVVAVERFTRADTSVAGQALKIAAARPDAVLVVAVGGGAALPQKALKDRGYRGKIYHTAASLTSDFIRLAGKDADGALVMSGPEQVAEQLPESHPGRKLALEFVQAYESKYGAKTRTQFSAHIYDIGVMLQQVVPIALKKGQPGTADFRSALRDALENTGATGGIVTTKGVLRYTPSDHWGYGPDARVMVSWRAGDWHIAKP
jgi:branched-chain amino acid transport system substrate-binding protein